MKVASVLKLFQRHKLTPIEPCWIFRRPVYLKPSLITQNLRMDTPNQKQEHGPLLSGQEEADLLRDEKAIVSPRALLQAALSCYVF